MDTINHTKSLTVGYDALARLKVIYVANVLQAHILCHHLVQMTKGKNKLLRTHYSFAEKFCEDQRNNKLTFL